MISPAECFKEIFRTQVNRPGADKLMEWLESTDFFTAPASTKYHGAYEGGLVKHSLEVYYSMLSYHILSEYRGETCAIVALLHDVCKADYYEKTENGWAINDRLPMGHGEKSVYLIQKHMALTDTEALAIRWHMGAYDDAFRGGSKALNVAMDRNPLILALHTADMIATQKEKADERRLRK